MYRRLLLNIPVGPPASVPPLSEANTRIVLFSSPISRRNATRRPRFWSTLSSIAA
jgi:hypothetical protein